MLDRRLYDLEFLDQPDFSPGLARQSYAFMAFVNRLFGGIRTVRRFVAEEARRQETGRPLRVLDIGSGICDIPIAVARWAGRRNINVRLTCLETSPYAPAIARARIERAGLTDRIQLLRQDVFTHRPSEPYDCAVGSMFFHHLREDEILALVRHLRTFVRRSILISDLGRSWADYAGAWLLTLPLARQVRQDALLSVRRAFTPPELAELLHRLPDVAVQAGNTWLFRVQAVTYFAQGGAS